MHGRNELEEKTKSWYRLYAEQFVEPMVRSNSMPLAWQPAPAPTPTRRATACGY
jgi:hypothetical protein